MPSVRQRHSNIQALRNFTVSPLFPLCRPPSRILHPISTGNTSLRLDRPKPIDNYLRAYGVPENFISQLSPCYMSKAMELYNSINMRYDRLSVSLPPLPGQSPDSTTPCAIVKLWVTHYEAELGKWKEQCLYQGLRYCRSQKPCKGQFIPSRFSESSLKFLKAYFRIFDYPSAADRQTLAQMTGNSLKQISDWFQNNRNRTSKRTGKKLIRPKLLMSFDEVFTILCKTLEPTVFESLRCQIDCTAPEGCTADNCQWHTPISELHALIRNECISPHCLPVPPATSPILIGCAKSHLPKNITLNSPCYRYNYR